MKKKILSLALAMTLVLAYAVPVAATESTAADNDVTAVTEETASPNGEGEGTVAEDPQVQAAYDAYVKMVEAMNANEYGPMKDYYDEVVAITDAFTDEQSEEWTGIVEKNQDIFYNLIIVATIIYTVELEEAYKADPNEKTAYEFVTYYDECTELGVSLELMVPGIESDYEKAKAEDMPDANVLEVYNAYSELQSVLIYGYDEDFIKAYEGFEAVVDTFNVLTEAELDDLAVLMGVEDGETAWNQIFTDWINANLIKQLGEAQAAFEENPNAETAKEYIDLYDSIVNDTQWLTDEDKEMILATFGETTYEAAKAYLADEDIPAKEDPADTDENTANVSDKSNKDDTPKTGDESNMLAPFAVMIAAAGVAAAALKRKRVQ